MLLYVVSLVVFVASCKATGTRKRSIFGEPPQEEESRRRLIVNEFVIAEDSTTITHAVPFKVELCPDKFAMTRVLVHLRMGDTLETELLTLDDNGNIQIKEFNAYNGLVAVDKNSIFWKSPSVNSAAFMVSEQPCDAHSVPIRSQSMVMSSNGDFVVFFSEHSLVAEVLHIDGSGKRLFELEASPLTAVTFRDTFRGNEIVNVDEIRNNVWVALTNGKVAKLSFHPMLEPVRHWTVPGDDEITVFRVRSDTSRIAYMRTLRERSIYICEISYNELLGDKCAELRTNGPVVADFHWHGEDQILCRAVTGSMFVWNVAERFYAEWKGVEDVSAFTTDSGRVYIAHSDGSFEVTQVPDFDWTHEGDASVERSTTRRVAYFARHPQAAHNVDGIWGTVALFIPNAKVTDDGCVQLLELRLGMRAMTVDETADKQVYDELHDASKVYVAMSPLVRAVWAALYALAGICQGQIAQNYAVHIHGALQNNPPIFKTTMADACGPMQTKEGVKAAAISGFGEVEYGQRLLDSVEINEDYNLADGTYTYNAKQLLTEVRDSQTADGKVLFAAGHSQWFQYFINDDKLKLDATSQQFRDDLNANQKGKLHNCQVVRFEYEVAADGSIQMWDCRSVFTPHTQTR